MIALKQRNGYFTRYMYSNFRRYLIQKFGLSESDIAPVISSVKTREVKKGTFLLHPGEICKHTFFVENGLLRLFALDENGREHILQFGSENWLVTDRDSVYFNEPSKFYIEAIENSFLILLDANFFSKIAALSPDFRKKNENLLHKHIRQLNERINLLLSANAKTRYIEFIRLYPDLQSRVPQWMVASYLGITPESLSRVRKELTKENP